MIGERLCRRKRKHCGRGCGGEFLSGPEKCGCAGWDWNIVSALVSARLELPGLG